MFKRLAICALLACILPIYGQEKSPKTNSNQKPAQAIEPRLPAAFNPVSQPAPQQQEQGAESHPKSYLERLLSPENLPNIGLLIAGIVGITVAIRTFKVLREQTSAAKDAAEAALLNAKAVINAERALLLFNVVRDEKTEVFTVRVVNYGRVPARRIEISKPIRAVMKLEDLIASPPDYGDDIDNIQEWLAPKESWPVAAIHPRHTRASLLYDAERRKLPPSDVDHITYGQVTYFDGISPELRHSRYCIALDDDHYEPISVVGNEAYLECT